MSKFADAFELIEEIEEHAGVCCAITMDPDDIHELCNKLKQVLTSIIQETQL